jgi:hypothetical protein
LKQLKFGQCAEDRGVGAIARALEHEREAGVSVCGRLAYVVMAAEEFQRLFPMDIGIHDAVYRG